MKINHSSDARIRKSELISIDDQDGKFKAKLLIVEHRASTRTTHTKLNGFFCIVCDKNVIVDSNAYRHPPFEGIPGLVRMVEALFKDEDREMTLALLSRSVGKLKAVKKIVWLYIFMSEKDKKGLAFKECMDTLYESLWHDSVLYVVNERASPGHLSVYKEIGFRKLEGVPYMIAGKFYNQRNVKFKVWYD